ncbi:helix-turn-helix domain-containing protein [Flavobacterium sp. ENC]|uniref:helix-turn-helix domain-containing protein n=1 Tax=Flavobacterium sp. ENC TaxID=2897330 RepID=UPI001E3EA6AB|nr:helix-turn-helix transcriptional regulator [Flavobacterium sp. ENC]MCD0467381.1 helix-turn-helix domain-containing protein [Flavobacterium sp. ENC]
MFTSENSGYMNRIVGNKLKKLRQAKDMSREEVANGLCMSQSAYARIERGESCSWASYMNRICEFFQLTPEELVKDEEEPIAKNNDLIKENKTLNALLNVYANIIMMREGEILVLKAIIEDLKSNTQE